MEKAEYIVKFRGDYSALAKDLKNIGAETKKIEDDEVIIKLAYDGNIKEFNKVFDKISKMHPELGIQFQYNVNEKILKQEMKKLDELTELKLNVDEGKVQAKLEKLAENVEFALEEGMSKDEITKRLKNVFGYYNTAVKAGAKNINFKDIKDRLDDAFSIETDEIQDIFGEVFDLNINKPIQLFKIDRSINEDIAMTQERVDDLKDSLKSLEEKGASKSGSSSEMKQLQDDIKILRSDIEDMKTQLQNLSGEAFDEMTESIKKTSEQLTGVIEKLKILSMSGVNGFEITSLKTLLSDFSEFAQKRNSKNLSDYWSELQTKIDNGDKSLKKALIDLKLFNEETGKINIVGHGDVKSGGLTSNEYTLLATKEASHQTDNTINSRLQDTIVLKDKLDEAADAGVNVARILNVVYDKTSDTMFQLQETAKGVMLGGQGEAPINLEAFNASDEAIQKLISDIIYLRKIGVGVDFHGLNVFYDQISDTFSLIDTDLKPTEYGEYGENDTFENDILGGLISSFENAEGKMPEVAQKFVDRVKNILTSIDTSGIEQSAKEATQKAADALQEAQDSNSPAELTKPLGKGFGLGYAEGIREAMPDIIEACKEIVLAAYDAVKETSDAKNGEGNNFLDNFINNLKESLDNAAPTIQEKIKEVFSKINIDNISDKSSLSSISSEDFQTQLQNTIDETGKYIIRVYGELIDDFKSRLQNSIDETGIYHVDIEGWLYDTFHSRLQDDIDGQERYFIEVNGELIETFKDVVQEAIENLGAFPIEVKPYMRKGGEIEEVDLPSGNNNSEEQLEDLSYGTDAYRIKVKQLTSSIVEMNNRGEEETVEYINTVKELLRLFDMFKKVADFPIGTNQAKKFEAFITNEKLNAGFDGDDTTSDISKAGVMIIDRFIDSATSKFMNLDKMIDDIISRNGNVAKYVNPIIEAEDRFISPTQQFDDEVQQNLVMLENYENTIKEIDKLKVDPETDEAKRKIQELNKLADYFASQITVIRSENGHEVNRSMMYFNGVPNNNLMEHYSMDDIERFTHVANERTGLNRDTVFNKFVGIEEELNRIEHASEGLRNALTKNLSDSKAYVSRVRADLLNLVEIYEELEHVKEGSRDYELYQKDIGVFSERTPEVLQFLDKIKTYDQAYEFVKTDEWLDFLATLPQAHTYLESIGYDFDKINRVSNETPVSTESTESETKALLSKKEVIEQLRTELNLTKKAAEELFNSQGYTSENGRYKIEKDTVDELILSLKKKNELEESSSSSAIPLTDEESEQVILNNLLIMLENIIKKVDEKTRAFQEEGQVVEGVVQNELTNLDVLSGYLINLRDEVSKVSAEFQGIDVKINIKDTGVDKITKFVSALSKIKDDKIKESLEKISLLLNNFVKDVNNLQINDNNILTAINSILSKSKELENLTSVLKESKKKIKDVQKEVTNEKQEASDSAIRDWISDVEKDIPFDAAKMKKAIDISSDFNKADSSLQLLSDLYGEVSESVHVTSEEIKNNTDVLNENTDAQKKNSDSTNTSKKKKEPKNYSDTYNNKLSELGTKLSGDIKFYEGKGKNTEQYLDQLREINEEISAMKKLDVATEDDIKTLNAIEERIKIIKREASFAENKVANEKSVQKWLGQINDILSKNTSRKFKSSELYQEFVELQNAFKHFDTSSPQNELDELGQKALETITKFKGLDESFKGGGFLSNFTHRLSDMNAKFLAQYFSWQDMIRYARQAITNIIQLNDAFIELSKVSNTSIKDLESDFQSYADIAKRIGGTITDTINATADWARMGYNIPDSKKLAEVALLYKNVGDGIDISQANESLISTLQGFQMQADEAEHIVDVFNEVANNYAIDTGGIGEALQRSASSLNAANTSLEESVALVTAANTVVQNPESVGTTFKTLSARIRGASTELEELGEEEDEFTKTTSKLQGLIKGLTGFDILESDQKTFKSIYDILVGIGKEWNNLEDIERASLGEALAGKRNANTLYAVLDNIETLESAYQTAEESAGSAQREQENYQKGITYSINQAKAALEELSYDLASSNFVKTFVNIGTKAINVVDILISKGNLFKKSIIAIAALISVKVRGSIIDLMSTLTALKASVISVGKTIASALGKATLGAGIAWLASTGLQLLGGVVHKLRVSIFGYTKKELEEIKGKTREAAETAQSAFKELQETTTANAKTLNDVKTRYAELAQGVKDLGLATQSQGSLSNDEYAEFLDISNELIQAFPTLSAGYSDNGDALTTLNGDVNTITSSLNELLNVERQLAQVKLQEHAKDVWAGYGVDVNDASKKYNEATDTLNRYQKAYDFYMDQIEKYKEYIANGGEELTFSQFFDKNYMDYNEEVEGIREIFGTDKFISESDLFGSSVDQYADKFEELYKGVVAKYQKVVDGASNDIEQGGKKIKETVLGLFQFDEDYTSLGGEDKNIINAILSSMGYDTDYHKLRKGANWDEVYKDIKNRTIGFIQGLSEEDRTGLTGAYENLRNFKGSNQTIAQYKEEIQKVKDILENSNAEGTVKNAILDSLPSDSEIENKIDHLKAIMGENWNDDMENQFTANELEIAGQLELKADPYNLTEIKDEIDKIINPVEIEPEIKASAAVDSMASAKQAINSLDELYNQVVKMEGKDGQVTGFADPTLINNVESGFKDFIKEASESGKDVTELNSALEEFERIMIEQPNDAEAASKAMDDLITAYIDQTDIVKNLTEENAEWSIKQLEVMGIENAEKVVMTRLSKASKGVSKALSELNSKLIENEKSLDKSKKGTAEYADAIKDIIPEVQAALTVYDEEGNATFTPEIDSTFVEKYMEDINAMANGSIEALSRVRAAAAQRVAMTVMVNVPTEVAEQQLSGLIDILEQVDNMNVEAGAYIDDAPFLSALAEMMKQSDIAADSVAAAFQSMGYEVEWVPKPYRITYVKAHESDIKSTSAFNAMMQNAVTDEAYIDIPSLRIKRSGSAGAGAHYTGAPSSTSDSSSGGGGGGGGSEPTQPKDDTEETFDWIEVAIQRIEEEMARLDKIVGNSYIKWSDRNSALTDEINKTTEAIKAQELAEEEYYRNANELQVNDGKGLNDDDYGENDYLVKEHDQKLLDEARAIWATGEYQEKVKHGLLTGDDIEKIQNKYLVETIKTYQEWINKGIAAGDAADDLRIKLGDLARTSFDHVKDEYDELIAFVTGSADIIDEKINRTEKKGYFVDKAYYHDLMALEEENYNYLAKKRDEMIKKRDEAVAAGYIEENSSEWNKMSQEIDGVTLAIEQSETKMVEYNNTLRQLDWDMFDWIEDRISRINSEAAFLVDLMSEERLVDDNGVFTAQGEATNAMYAVQYETYMRQARDYAEERKKIEADLINDPGNKELIKRREELIDLEQESIKNAQQEKEAIKSLVQEAINKQIEAMQKLVDEYKKSLQEARDLFTYQQNIQKQTENIANLRKQLAAYAGDDSEENRARVQKLQQQLEEAEQQLQETEWDKYISETEKFLDDMMDDYSETLNKKLEDIDSLIEEMIQHANNNADTVAQTIQDETDKVGYTLTDEFSNIISGGRDQMVTDLQSAADSIATAITNVQTVIESIKEYVAEMAEYGKKTEEVESSGGSSKSDSDSGSDKKSDDSKKSDGGKKSDEGKKDEGSKGSGTNRKLTDKDYYGVALAIINGNYGWGTGEDRDSKLKAKGFDVNRVRDIINKLYAEGYIHSGAWVGRYQGITDLSPYAFNKYAKGSKRISSDQLAWTQEKGQELIFRSSDGAMLTPLNTGDKVFTAQMTDNLWELAKGRFTTNIPKSAKGNTINNSNAISITLPNVKNYEEFKTALQNDPKMTSFIQQITLGEISNGIKLNKKKY